MYVLLFCSLMQVMGGWLLKMTVEMTADYIMIKWLVAMTAEMTAGLECDFFL